MAGQTEYIDLRRVGREGLAQIRRQVVRLKKMGRSGREIEEIVGIRRPADLPHSAGPPDHVRLPGPLAGSEPPPPGSFDSRGKKCKKALALTPLHMIE